MKSIGIRCWKDKFSYVVLEGTQEEPTRLLENHLSLPQKLSRPEQLVWFKREIKELMDTNDIDCAIFKATETISRTKDPTTVAGKIKTQINKDTNARKAKYVGELIVSDAFDGLAKGKYEEAFIAALSGLPKD